MTKGQINENATMNLKTFKFIAWETVDNSYYESIGDYQTLYHGDAWQNNAMFRYYGLLKVNLESSFSFPGFSLSGLDLVFKFGFQT